METVKHESKHADAYCRWGLALRKLGMHKEACDKFAEAVKHKPQYSTAYFNWGIALSELNCASDARDMIKKAHELGFVPPDGWPEWFEQTE